MILIVAAKHKLDQQALDSHLALYDHAQTSNEREQVAGEIEALVGPAVKGMLVRSLGGLGLTSEDFANLATESVQRALQESGLTRLKRQDVVPENLVREMQRTQRGQALWSLLSPTLQQSLADNERWVKADLGQQLADTLSQLLTLPDLASRLGERGDVIPSLVERTKANAELLHQLFPDAVKEVVSPERSLLGYVASNIVPELKRRLLREKAPAVTDTMRANWNIIRPYVETLRGKFGREPTSEEVYEWYRGDLEDRTENARRWMEQQIARIQPNNSFQIKSPIDLKVARELLEAAGVEPSLWREPGAPYYVSKRDVKPLSKASVEKLMQAPGLGAPATPSAEHVMPTEPAPQEATPDWTPLMTGDQNRLQAAILDRVFGQPGYEAEYAVSYFLSYTPNPRAAEVERFLASLSPDVADDIRQIGWDAMVREVDERIRGFLRDPEAVQEIAAELGMSSGAARRSAYVLRRTIFARCTRFLSRECAGIPPLLGFAKVQLDGRGRAYLSASERIFNPVAMEVLRAISEYVAGNPTPSEEQVHEFVASLPEHISSFVREVGWDKLSRIADAAVIEMLSTESN